MSGSHRQSWHVSKRWVNGWSVHHRMREDGDQNAATWRQSGAHHPLPMKGHTGRRNSSGSRQRGAAGLKRLQVNMVDGEDEFMFLCPSVKNEPRRTRAASYIRRKISTCSNLWAIGVAVKAEVYVSKLWENALDTTWKLSIPVCI